MTIHSVDNSGAQLAPEEMAREVLDLIREGKLDTFVIKLSSACRDRMREQDWYLRTAHGPDVGPGMRTVELPSD